MTHVLDAWHRFTQWQYWWMHTMVLIWLLFTILLFILEPRARRRQSTSTNNTVSAKHFNKILTMHRILLSLSIITVAGAVAGSHGWLIAGGMS